MTDTRSEALRDLRIIPRSPSPIALAERPLTELTREELLEIVEKQRVWHPFPSSRRLPHQYVTLNTSQAQQALNEDVKVNLKREREDDIETSYRSTRAFCTLRSGETVDLTDD